MDPHKLSDFISRVHNLDARSEIDAAMVEVLDAFDAEGVGAIVLKGPALEAFLYGDGEHRSYSDVDLLVAPDAVAKARDALSRLGYLDASAHALWGVEDVADIQNAEIWTHSGPGRQRPLMVDLHWRIYGWNAPAEATWAALATRQTTIEVDGRRVQVLDREGLAVHVASHAAQHGPGDPKALADLSRAVERWPDQVWESAAELAEAVGATPTFAAGLRLLPAGAALAERLSLPQTDRLTWEILHRDDRPRGIFHLQAAADAKTMRERIGVVRRSLFPTRVWILRRYTWAERGRAQLGAAYALHIISAPSTLARAYRFRRRSRRLGS